MKFCKVIQSAPVSLKIALFNWPLVWAGAVIILELPWIVIVLVDVPDLVMSYPPAGAVSFPYNVITTGDEIVAAFNAVIAAAKVAYEDARPEPLFVKT